MILYKNNFSAPQITIYRDLECWEMNFSWNPIGTYTGFRFEIRMKAPELRDVKVTRRSGSLLRAIRNDTKIYN